MSFVDQSAVDDLLKQFGGADAAVESAATARAGGGMVGESAAPTAMAAPMPEFSTKDLPPELRRLMAIEVPVIVLLGQRGMTVGEVMRLAVGAIVEFHKSAEEELELHVNNMPIGAGHAVKVGENFGIKISTIGSVRDVIRKLGGN